MAQTTTSTRRGNAGEDTRGNATRPRGNTKSQRGNAGGTQRRAPRRDFGRLTKLPSGKFRARYLGPDGQLYNAPRTFVARIDAEGWLAQVERTISRGEWEPPAKVEAPVAEVMLEFESVARTEIGRRELTPKTRELYTGILERLLLPTFGQMKVDEITPRQVRAWFDSLDADKPTQRQHAYALLKSIMAACVAEELISSNPCRLRSAGKRKTTRLMQPATVEQLGRVATELPLRSALPVLIAGWCGLRSGEVRALRVRDVDVDEGWILVRQGVTRVKGRVIIGPPKTPAAVRNVAVPPHLLPMMREWLWQVDVGDPTCFFFPGRGSGPMSEKALRCAFEKARDVMGRDDLTFHDLRHTAATLAAQNGATTAELMARMGHTTAQMAMRYQHASAERDQQLARRLAALAAPEWE